MRIRFSFTSSVVHQALVLQCVAGYITDHKLSSWSIYSYLRFKTNLLNVIVTRYGKFSCVKKNTCTVIVDNVRSAETECPEMPVASAVSHAAQQKFSF